MQHTARGQLQGNTGNARTHNALAPCEVLSNADVFKPSVFQAARCFLERRFVQLAGKKPARAHKGQCFCKKPFEKRKAVFAAVKCQPRLKARDLARQRGKLCGRDVGRIAHQHIERTFRTACAIGLDNRDALLKPERLDIVLRARDCIVRYVGCKHMHACFLGKRAGDTARATANLERMRHILTFAFVLCKPAEHHLDEHLSFWPGDEHAFAHMNDDVPESGLA